MTHPGLKPQRPLHDPERWDLSEKGTVELDQQAIRVELYRVIAAPSFRPPLLPSVTIELLQLSSRASVEPQELVRLLERDGLLAGRVFQIARSPLYAPQMELRSLKAAVVRLGLSAIRNIVMEVSLSTRVFRAPVYADALAEVQRHSTAVAHLARLVARQTTFDAEFAFLCGLLHDVGLSVGMVAMADTTQGKEAPRLQQLYPVLDALHEQVAGLVATHWQLPPELRYVIEHHHSLSMGGVVHPVAAVVALADELAMELGYVPRIQAETPHVRVADITGEHRRSRALAALGMTPDHFAALSKAAQSLMATVPMTSNGSR